MECPKQVFLDYSSISLVISFPCHIQTRPKESMKLTRSTVKYIVFAKQMSKWLHAALYNFLSQGFSTAHNTSDRGTRGESIREILKLKSLGFPTENIVDIAVITTAIAIAPVQCRADLVPLTNYVKVFPSPIFTPTYLGEEAKTSQRADDTISLRGSGSFPSRLWIGEWKER